VAASTDLVDRQEFALVRLTAQTVHGGHRVLAAETPIAISFLGIGYAVMMATPSDLQDFAVGFSYSERIIDAPEQVTSISIAAEERGLLLNVEVSRDREDIVLRRVRHRATESSCGLCGIENLEQALRPLPRVGKPPEIERGQLFSALQRLGAHQPLNAETGAVHAAAHFRADGSFVAAREDVGRHNAFDKLIGHALRSGIDLSSGFVVLTARCSYELVEKAALANIPLLISISAPTTLAVERAQQAGLTLIALAREDSMLVMTDPHGLFAREGSSRSPTSS
jgi:FdhD protein